VPTALSSTDPALSREARWLRPVRDVGHLLRFRSASVRRRAALWWTVAAMLALTLAAAAVPAFVPAEGDRRLDFGVVLPSAMAGLLLLAVVSAIASGGGRELVSREQGVAFPVSPATDHLGALVLAPLNIAWLIQAWVLLGSAAFVVGARFELAALQVVMLLWLAIATAAGQLVAWTFETVRRRRHGIAVVRLVLTALAAAALAVQLTGRTTDVLDRVPTVWLLAGGLGGFDGRWLLTVGVEVAVLAVVVVVGVLPVTSASRLMPHDELRAETDLHTPRRMPWSDLTALLRLDRASVWRSVPMRRGLGVLAIGPGVVALLGDLPWPQITILPGLVASGGALLFGVNAWCLDARGALWRENLPAAPGTVFWARVIVLAEFLALASLATIAIAALRAGVPTVGEATALACTLLVVTVQVVGASMRWSERRPYPVDLRSARATPAPPVMMVAYSSRLAVCTTLTGLVFSGLAQVPNPVPSVFVAILFLTWSSVRLARSATRWDDPVTRARVVVTVAA
jgi:hypothetical protein